MPELLGDAPPDAAEPADDVVVAQRLDRLPPPPFSPEPADDPSRDRLDDERADVRKDTDPSEHQEDRQDAGAVGPRNGVEARQRAGDDRPVERLQPRLVERRPEADGSDRQHDGHRAERVREAPEAEGVIHARSIVGPWKTRSAEHTSELQSRGYLACRL